LALFEERPNKIRKGEYPEGEEDTGKKGQPLSELAEGEISFAGRSVFWGGKGGFLFLESRSHSVLRGKGN